MIIRPARAEEQLVVHELQRRAWEHPLEPHLDSLDPPSVQTARREVLVAERDGRVVGFAALDGGDLRGLFVEPADRRQGIGSALVDSAVHEARRRGLSLTVLADPQVAAFFQRCGFALEEEASASSGPAVRMSR